MASSCVAAAQTHCHHVSCSSSNTTPRMLPSATSAEAHNNSCISGTRRCATTVAIWPGWTWNTVWLWKETRESSWTPCHGRVCATEGYDRQSDNPTTTQGRAKPKIPRLLVGNSTLQEFTKSLEDKLHLYEENSKPGLLFSAEERHALNRSKPDLDTLSSEKWPLLHTLAVSGDSIYVDRLLKQDVDVNALDKDGYSALQRAVVARKEQMVNQLLRAHADANIRDKGGATLLHYSVQTGSMTLVRTFLSSGVDVNAADKHGWTALHLAVLTGRADIVRFLLISGADKALENKDGLTALDLCFSLGRAFNSIEVAKALKRFPKEKPTVGGFKARSLN